MADVWDALELGERPAGLLYAVNREYAGPESRLAEGEEVALIPPVSGGDFLLSEEPIDVAAVVARVADDERRRDRHLPRHDARALAGPHGPPPRLRGLRGHGRGGDGADRRGSSRAVRARAVAITHRIGRVGIGETSVAIAVSAPHRDAALAACKDAIDTLKETVPLWKKEVYEGGEEWIGRGS